jgi:Uma2 family endonuclease
MARPIAERYSSAVTQAAHPLPPSEIPSRHDQRVILHGVTWSQYETLLEIRGDQAGVRMTYLEGELELMSPSRDHEAIKKLLARLLEAYAEERDLELEGYGSMTMRSAPRGRGVEPDECYALGGPKDHPDIAIEVIWTSGGLDKLEVYRGLGVREVWLWKDGRLSVHALRGDRYEGIARSELIPDLDLELLESFVGEQSQTRAVKSFRAILRRG